MARAILGIDPGDKGGIAIHVDGDTTAYKMPTTLGALHSFFMEVAAQHDRPIAYYENNNGHRPGNRATASTGFARHMGHIDALLLALGYEIYMPSPAKWMNVVVPGRPKGEKYKTARKRYIREEVERRFPGVDNIINDTADALGILAYGMETRRG